MAAYALLFLQTTLLLLTCWAARSANVSSKTVSRATQATKLIESLRIEVADLQSLFASLMDSHKRLRSRIGMKELREKAAEEPKRTGPPPPGAPKAELRAYYLNGKSPKQIATEVAGADTDAD